MLQGVQIMASALKSKTLRQQNNQVSKVTAFRKVQLSNTGKDGLKNLIEKDEIAKK
jgi:hypothetical protein